MCIHALAHTERYVVVSWTPLSVTLYLHCLPCYWLKFDVYFWSFHAFYVPSLHSLLKFQVIWFWTPCVSVCLVPELQNITVFLSPRSSSVIVLWNVRNSSSCDIPQDLNLEQSVSRTWNLAASYSLWRLVQGVNCEAPPYSVFSILLLISISGAHIFSSQHPLLKYPSFYTPPFLSRVMLVPLKVRTWNQTVKSLVVPVEKSHSVWMLHIL